VQDCWDEVALYQGLVAQDARALEALIARYARELTYFIRIVLAGIGTAQDAEECVNDLFVAAWTEIEEFDPQRGNLNAWLSMRAKYLALDRRRQIQRRLGVPAGAAATESAGGQAWPAYRTTTWPPAREQEAGETLDGLLERRERQDELRQVLEELPELDRLLVYLRYFRLAGTDEIAARTGLTRRAIDTRLWRTRKNLRDALEALEERTHGQVRAF
jgi:RNA polymerase sigma-70 factor (ECF subfamily)